MWAWVDSRMRLCCDTLSARTGSFLSRSYSDFENLHLLVLEAQGRHRGILVERFDDDPKHNMTLKEIVRAVGNIEASGISLVNEYQLLNPWQ